MATTKGKKIGPRVSVKIGQKKGKGGKTKDLYAFMTKKAAEMYGFKAENAVIKNKKGVEISVRGSRSNAIKLPQTASAKATKVRYVSVAMPNEATIPMIKKFLQGATKNKPESFVSKFGRTHYVTKAK